MIGILKKVQCQVTLRKKLDVLKNSGIKCIYESPKHGSNMKYDNWNLVKKFYSNKKMITLKIMSQSLVIKTLWYEATNDMTKICQTSIKNLYLQFS